MKKIFDDYNVHQHIWLHKLREQYIKKKIKEKL